MKKHMKFMYVILLFLSSCANPTAPDNYPPIIYSLIANKDTIYVGERITFTIDAHDRDADDLDYTWYEKDVDGEDCVYALRTQDTTFTCEGKTPGVHTMYCLVRERNEGKTRASVNFTVIEAPILKANFVLTDLYTGDWVDRIRYEIENTGETEIYYSMVYFIVTYTNGVKVYCHDTEYGIIGIGEKKDCVCILRESQRISSVEVDYWVLQALWEFD